MVFSEIMHLSWRRLLNDFIIQWSLYTYLFILIYCVSEADDGRYLMWKLLLRLLQDEDETVRHVASQTVTLLTQIDNSLSAPPGE